MKKISIHIILLLIISGTFGCFGENSRLFLRPVERPDIDIVRGRAGLIRSLYCDVYVEFVDIEAYEILKKNGVFSGKGEGYPAEPCFFITVVNTWNRPVRIEKIESSFEGESIASEDFSFIKKPGYTSSRYSVNLESMMQYRRILTDSELLREIDFANDTIEYRLDFIVPGDRVSFFRFFRRVPGSKSSKISITIKYFDLKKVIDFDIGRFDYTEIIDLR